MRRRGILVGVLLLGALCGLPLAQPENPLVASRRDARSGADGDASVASVRVSPSGLSTESAPSRG